MSATLNPLKKAINAVAGGDDGFAGTDVVAFEVGDASVADCPYVAANFAKDFVCAFVRV